MLSQPCPHFSFYISLSLSKASIPLISYLCHCVVSSLNFLLTSCIVNPQRLRIMCTSKSKLQSRTNMHITPMITQANGRPVLQPTCNQLPSAKQHYSIKKAPLKSSLGATQPNAKTKTSKSPPISPKLKSPRPVVLKQGDDPTRLNSGSDKISVPKSFSNKASLVSKGKKSSGIRVELRNESSLSKNFTSLAPGAPGSIAAARREQVSYMQKQRKMRIAHYGRKGPSKDKEKVPPIESAAANTSGSREAKRCSFITPNSDPIFVAYHDEEWGVPVQDDKLLFEMLELTGAQVGSDWTSVLKKREDYRKAFSGFDAEALSRLTEKKITSLVNDYGIDVILIRGVIDNAKQILKVQREFGSFSRYLWRFVNYKPISTQYRSWQKIPVKTSKSEAISKDMVKRGFRSVGPTCIHSFMQAAGLTNDHLITCPQHLKCSALALKGHSLRNDISGRRIGKVISRGAMQGQKPCAVHAREKWHMTMSDHYKPPLFALFSTMSRIRVPASWTRFSILFLLFFLGPGIWIQQSCHHLDQL